MELAVQALGVKEAADSVVVAASVLLCTAARQISLFVIRIGLFVWFIVVRFLMVLSCNAKDVQFWYLNRRGRRRRLRRLLAPLRLVGALRLGRHGQPRGGKEVGRGAVGAVREHEATVPRRRARA
jgi:hypothetical protein